MAESGQWGRGAGPELTPPPFFSGSIKKRTEWAGLKMGGVKKKGGA